MSKEVGKKISAKKKGWKPNFTQEWKDNISASLKGHKPFMSKNHTKRSIQKIKNNTVGKAHKRILKEIKEFEKQGYRCVPTGGIVRPDFVAVKDGKIFAVEVEYGRPNYSKYTKEIRSFVDDVIWLIRRGN